MSLELAASYFDAERIAANPDHTYLSEDGADQLIEWIGILDEYDYPLDAPSDIQNAAAFLISHGDSEVDIMTTQIMLAYAKVVFDGQPA